MRRLKGNTLVEVLTGLALLSLVLVLGLALFQQLGGAFSVFHQQQMRAYARTMIHTNTPLASWQSWEYKQESECVSPTCQLIESELTVYYGAQVVHSQSLYHEP